MKSIQLSVNSPSLSEPIETGDAAEALRSLRRGLERAHGFALFVAVVKTPAKCNELITLLGEAAPTLRLQTVTLRPETTDILDEVIQQVGSSQSGPVMIVGLEATLSPESSAHPLLQSLNLRRPEWPKRINQPVVLWVPDFLYGLLARSAPDFLDWRSDTLHFPELEPNQFLALQSATWEGGLDTQMPAAARRGRVQELASRIKANENTDDPVIQDAVAGWLNELGLHFMLLGRWRDAKVCFERMLVFVRRLGNRHGEAAALNSLGNIFASLGDTKQAVESYNKSLGIAKEINHLPDIGAALGNLGTVYSDLGDYQRAVVFYSQSLEVARLSGDRRGESAAVGNLGIAFKNLGDFNRAIEFHTQHLELARKLGDRLGEGNALGGLGNAYAAKGDDGQALTFHRQQHEIAHKIGNMRGEGSSLFNEALSLDSLGRRSEAICQAKVALKIFEEIKDPNTARVRKQLADWQGAAAG